MNDKPSDKHIGQTQREARLKAALKANMAKRKAQARARAAGSTNETHKGIAAPDNRKE